jgi:hypothetical protein
MFTYEVTTPADTSHSCPIRPKSRDSTATFQLPPLFQSLILPQHRTLQTHRIEKFIYIAQLLAKRQSSLGLYPKTLAQLFIFVRPVIAQ